MDVVLVSQRRTECRRGNRADLILSPVAHHLRFRITQCQPLPDTASNSPQRRFRGQEKVSANVDVRAKIALTICTKAGLARADKSVDTISIYRSCVGVAVFRPQLIHPTNLQRRAQDTSVRDTSSSVTCPAYAPISASPSEAGDLPT